MKGWKDYRVTVQYTDGSTTTKTVRALSEKDADWRAKNRDMVPAFHMGATITKIERAPQ